MQTQYHHALHQGKDSADARPASSTIRSALIDFETEWDRARADETAALADLLDIFDELADAEHPRAAAYAKTIVRQEHVAEQLSGIRADAEWRLQRAFRALRDPLR